MLQSSQLNVKYDVKPIFTLVVKQYGVNGVKGGSEALLKYSKKIKQWEILWQNIYCVKNNMTNIYKSFNANNLEIMK